MYLVCGRHKLGKAIARSPDLSCHVSVVSLNPRDSKAKKRTWVFNYTVLGG